MRAMCGLITWLAALLERTGAVIAAAIRELAERDDENDDSHRGLPPFMP